MVGCTVGERSSRRGSVDADRQCPASCFLIVAHARRLHAPMIVLKEFPAKYREPLKCFLDRGFSSIPSMPMTRLNIDYANFDEYMNKALNSATRRKLRKKFKAAAEAAPIDMSVSGTSRPSSTKSIRSISVSMNDRSFISKN